MKKMLLIVCAGLCFMEFSVQASGGRYHPGVEGYGTCGIPGWQSYDHPDDAEAACRLYYIGGNNVVGIRYHIDNFKLAMDRFGGAFLTWKFGHEEKTIVHCIVKRGTPETLRYVLGFFSTIDDLKDKNGNNPYDDIHTPQWSWDILMEYQQHPWRHSEDILELANKPAASSGSVLSDIFDRKALGTFATLVALGLVYWYKNNKDKKPSALAE
jgi:hypothetical protein